MERYFIQQRIERVKELIVYGDESLAGISDRLRFSSVSHLCSQFKKVAGLTPQEFRKQWQAGGYTWRPLPDDQDKS